METNSMIPGKLYRLIKPIPIFLRENGSDGDAVFFPKGTIVMYIEKEIILEETQLYALYILIGDHMGTIIGTSSILENKFELIIL